MGTDETLEDAGPSRPRQAASGHRSSSPSPMAGGNWPAGEGAPPGYRSSVVPCTGTSKPSVGWLGLNRTKALEAHRTVVNARTARRPGRSPCRPVGELKKLEGHRDEVKSVAFSLDGRYVASGSVDQTLRIWDLGTGKEDKAIRGHSKQIWSVLFHPSGRQVFTASWDATCRSWDIKGGNEIQAFQPPPRSQRSGPVARRQHARPPATIRASTCGTSPTARRSAASPATLVRLRRRSRSRRQAVRLGQRGQDRARLDLNTGQLVTFEGHSSAITNVAFSSDSRNVFASGDNVVQWDMATGKEVAASRATPAAVLGMRLSPDGRRLLTGGDDKTVRHWDSATGKELHRGAPWRNCFRLPDRRWVRSRRCGSRRRRRWRAWVPGWRSGGQPWRTAPSLPPPLFRTVPAGTWGDHADPGHLGRARRGAIAAPAAEPGADQNAYAVLMVR